MLKRLYDRLMALSSHPKACWWLALAAFVESSVFPIPPDVLMIPMVLAERRRAWFYAGLATVGSVAGAFLGYAIGAVFYDTLGQWVIHLYHLEDKAAIMTGEIRDNLVWIMAVKGMIPIIPFKLVTIASGIAHADLPTFAVACVLVRATRFYLVAAVLWKFGEPARHFIEKRLGLVTAACAVGLVGGFLLVKLV